MVQLLISKVQQQQVDWRRDRVLELSSQGFSQSDIANVLHVDRSIISRDTRTDRRIVLNQHDIRCTVLSFFYSLNLLG
jgi:transcriptional regulator